MDNEAGVVITLAQIYSEMQQMHTEVRDMRSDLKAAVSDTADHEMRLRALERRVWFASGIAAVMGAGGSELLKLLTKG